MKIKILINNNTIEKEFENPTSYFDILSPYQNEFDEDILLAFSNGKIKELHKLCLDDATVEPVFYKNKVANEAYRRTAIFILILTCKKIYGKNADIIVDYTIGNGLQISPVNFTIKEEDVNNILDTFNKIVEQKINIYKNKMSTEECSTLFENIGMTEKSKLFKYRLTSQTNVYSLSNLKDYFYGFMLKDTSYIKKINIIKDGEKLILLFPTKENFNVLSEYKKSVMLFNTLEKSKNWAKRLNCSYISQLNDIIAKEEINDLIMMQEASQEKEIGDIANKIYDSKMKFVFIAGPSSSGKTTFSHRLASHLRAFGLEPFTITCDNFFIDRELNPKDENGNYDFENINSLDVEYLNNFLIDLLNEKEVFVPRYNFFLGKRELTNKTMKLKNNSVLVLEGIHSLNEQMSYRIKKEDKFKIYISALTHIAVDEHNRIPATDLRLLRRIIRDNRTRGFSAGRTISMWPKVMLGEQRNIFPYQDQANVMFNSSLIYELSVLKLFAEPLLFNVDRESKEFFEAKRLLRFLQYALATSTEIIPKHSIIREFIGGSILNVE